MRKPTVLASERTVTVIIPTTCESTREASLLRAIDGLLHHQSGNVRVLVVVNGNRFDASLLESLRARLDIEVCYLERGSLPAALSFGRSQVNTPYFGFLDDDDEYLPGAIPARLAVMQADPTIDCVATNGYRQSSTKRTLAIAHVERVQADPLDALNTACWLASCGGLFRASSIDQQFFDPELSHIEWTALAFKIAAARRVAFLDEPTFIIHKTPQSLSGSLRYKQGVAKSLDALKSLPLPPGPRAKLLRKIAAAHLVAADSYAAQGDTRHAWDHFRRSWRFPTLGHARTALKLLKLQVWPAGARRS